MTSAAAFNLHGHPSTFFVLQVGGMPPASIPHVGRAQLIFSVPDSVHSRQHRAQSPKSLVPRFQDLNKRSRSKFSGINPCAYLKMAVI